MGMRQTVELQFGTKSDKQEQQGSIYIYSHWGGDDDINNSPLAQQVRQGLSRRERWGDESYLARIIFSEVIKDDIESDTGYGLCPSAWYCDEEFPRIVVDLTAETVNGISFEKFVTMYE